MGLAAYFDTSAIVPLLIEEPGTSTSRQIWGQVDRVVSCLLVYPETRAALARARRDGRIDERRHSTSAEHLNQLMAELDVLGVTVDLAIRSGDLAEFQALRGYDAVHLAAAEAVADEDLIFVTGDRRLRRAAEDLGIATALVGG